MRNGWPLYVLIFVKTFANILNKLQMMVNVLKKGYWPQLYMAMPLRWMKADTWRRGISLVKHGREETKSICKIPKTDPRWAWRCGGNDLRAGNKGERTGGGGRELGKGRSSILCRVWQSWDLFFVSAKPLNSLNGLKQGREIPGLFCILYQPKIICSLLPKIMQHLENKAKYISITGPPFCDSFYTIKSW